jgi:hypothetical protein
VVPALILAFQEYTGLCAVNKHQGRLVMLNGKVRIWKNAIVSLEDEDINLPRSLDICSHAHG